MIKKHLSSSPNLSAAQNVSSINFSEAGVNVGKYNQTLILAISTTCHFCSESADFYSLKPQRGFSGCITAFFRISFSISTSRSRFLTASNSFSAAELDFDALFPPLMCSIPSETPNSRDADTTDCPSKIFLTALCLNSSSYFLILPFYREFRVRFN
jgi:hypothetical protein